MAQRSSHDNEVVVRRVSLQSIVSPTTIKVPINPKFIFRLNKSFYNSEQNGANNFVFGQKTEFFMNF